MHGYISTQVSYEVNTPDICDDVKAFLQVNVGPLGPVGGIASGLFGLAGTLEC